ncbi:MAG: CRISPR-associated protein Cas5 [Methanosarcinales archaeon]
MVWLKAEYEVGSLFSYRIPNFSSQYALSSLLPGPSTIKLAIVATAIEMSGNPKKGEEVFEIIKNSKIKIKTPEKVSVFNVLIKRLKKSKTEDKFEKTFGIRGYVHFLETLIIFIEVKDDFENKISNILKKIRRFGTSDSLVFCKSVKDENPPEESIEPLDEMKSTEERNTLIIPVMDLNPEAKFGNVNPYDQEARKRDVLIQKFYQFPYIKQIQGKNWIVYETR